MSSLAQHDAEVARDGSSTRRIGVLSRHLTAAAAGKKGKKKGKKKSKLPPPPPQSVRGNPNVPCVGKDTDLAEDLIAGL